MYGIYSENNTHVKENHKDRHNQRFCNLVFHEILKCFMTNCVVYFDSNLFKKVNYSCRLNHVV